MLQQSPGSSLRSTHVELPEGSRVASVPSTRRGRARPSPGSRTGLPASNQAREREARIRAIRKGETVVGGQMTRGS